MRPVLWVLFLFALAVALTLLARFDPGYVLVVIPPWRLEMSFVLAAVAMLMLFGVLYAAARLLGLALRLPADVRAWKHRRRSDKADDDLSRAVAAWLAGQPARAHALAASAFAHERQPMAALVAAHAALVEGKPDDARRYLADFSAEGEEIVAARTAAESRLNELAAIDQTVNRG